MSSVYLHPSHLHGTVQAPPSKSAAHRAILCAALSHGTSVLHNVAPSEDILATCRAVHALGVETDFSGSDLLLDAGGLFCSPYVELDCGESGSTLRFLIPIVAAGGISARFTGKGRLPQRPIGIYLDCLPKVGVYCQTQGGLPLSINGKLRPGIFSLPGDVSSQFVTGFLFALPLLDGDSDIRLTTPLQSAGYVDMTIDIMREFGVGIEKTEQGWHIPGGQNYRSRSFTVEGDWSQAAFFLAAGALGNKPVCIKGLRIPSTQGDSAAAEIFARFGAKIEQGDGEVTVYPSVLHGIEIDASQVPDLVPILAVTGALAQGETRITGAARLRIKESDRLTAMADGINRLGGKVTELPDGLVIKGVPSFTGGSAKGCNDHRVVMALSVGALKASGPVEITDAHSICKSYPTFFEDYNALGGHANVIHMG